MTTLHILRSEPDEQVRELIRALGADEAREFALYEETVDYDALITELFRHHRVVSWW